jgi:hypothetical protein
MPLSANMNLKLFVSTLLSCDSVCGKKPALKREVKMHLFVAIVIYVVLMILSRASL